MVSVVDTVGLAVLLLGNTAIAALLTRFLRVRMHTRWGGLVYALLLVPVVEFVVMMVFSGIFKIGPNLGSAGAVVALTVGLPLAVGLTFDYFWMPDPEEVELPEKWEREEPQRRQRFQR